ncbi:MAG: CRR6 family NdhI maturation factor [Halothece sp. Uz-M2-17]|nr:CRR6 family NdhI maturation factor [Halothece sp. Uz-M2-17]
MTITIKLTQDSIDRLDLSPLQTQLDPILSSGTLTKYEQQFQFEIDYPRDPTDPRELSEIPEIRLWFLRLDTVYPWFIFFLDWRNGELARYTAMLVPHQFSRAEGIQFNPEALEIFVMRKVFVLYDWLQAQQISGYGRIISFSQMLGYEVDESFFNS